MDAISLILLLLSAVVASSFIARLAPAVLPLPLVQIALGAGIAEALQLRIELDPEIFFLLFIAPLLFLDGWRLPKEGLYRDKWTIAALAFGLVVFTVIGAGYFIHWMIPSMPLAVAFALAAVLSPTDAVSVTAIAARIPIPKRLVHILEGEALLNDASGLVCMRFAVSALLTGGFSITEAFGTFLWLATAGAAIGVAVTLVANSSKDWAARHFGEETGSHILVSLLIPFFAYLVATRLGASGILAAVAAGITMNRQERTSQAMAITRIRRAAVWDAVQFAGNGVVFVLLGDQLPGILAGARAIVREAGHHEILWLVLYVVAITVALAVLRFLWVRITLALVLFRGAFTGQTPSAPAWRMIAVTSLGGVRGALTLAGIMTLPLVLRDGTPLPTRDLAVLLAAGVIVASLIAANVGLPLLLRGAALPAEPLPLEQEDAARQAAAQAAIKAIEGYLHQAAANRPDTDLYVQSGMRLIAEYQQRLQDEPQTEPGVDRARKIDEIERRLHLAALGAERNEIYRLARTDTLPDESIRRLVREIDLQEARYSTR